MNKSGNLCITGVAGFIGGHVAREALRRGYRVTGIDWNQCHAGGVAFTKGDIRDKDHVASVMRDQDYVIHLAAITSNVEFVRNPPECYDINVNGFLNVMEAAARSGCKRFIYASSAAVYTDCFSEETVIDPSRIENHYAKSKIMNEMAAKSYQDIYTIKTTGLRYFNVYGAGENQKGDYASIVTLLLNAGKSGKPLILYGDGRQARDLIHVSDAARITVELLEKSSYDVYNVGTGVATAYESIAEMIDRRRIVHVPNPLPSYQYYTKAETARLRAALGDYAVLDVATGLKHLEAELRGKA